MTGRPLRDDPDPPDLSAVSTVFFDLDGVLADSRGPICQCINGALYDEGLGQEPVDRLASWIGISLHEVFESLLRDRGADLARAPDLVAAYRERYRRVALTTKPFPGAREAVASLAQRYQLMVVTSKPASFARPILEAMGMAGHFEEVFAPPLSNTHHEDKTGTLGRAVDHAGLPSAPRRPAGVMIGDRYVDVEAGRRHGLGTIGAAWGLGGAQELREAGADFIARTIGDVVSLLDPGSS